MKEKRVPSAWLEKTGRRLDCGPYLSGAVESRVLLDALPGTKKQLRKVTEGMDGIFNDLTYLQLLSKRQVAQKPGLIVREGWTLITCSGTIGRMAYAR